MAARLIYVAGEYGAGIHTFLTTVCAIFAVPLPRLEHTIWYPVPLDEADTLHFCILPPNLGNFHSLKPTPEYAEELNGCIILLDSTLAEGLTDTIINYWFHVRFNAPKIPLVITANKQDLTDALSPDEIRKLIYIPDDIGLVPCIAIQRESVKAVLLALLKRMSQDKVIEKAIAKIETL